MKKLCIVLGTILLSLTLSSAVWAQQREEVSSRDNGDGTHTVTAQAQPGSSTAPQAASISISKVGDPTQLACIDLDGNLNPVDITFSEPYESEVVVQVEAYSHSEPGCTDRTKSGPSPQVANVIFISEPPFMLNVTP